MDNQRLVVVVVSPMPELPERVSRYIEPEGHTVVGATTLEAARSHASNVNILAIDGQMLARVAWRGRELAENLVPERPVHVLGLVRREAHHPPFDIDLTKRGITMLYEPFKAPELMMVINWLALHPPRVI